jgi:hypothetical protein
MLDKHNHGFVGHTIQFIITYSNDMKPERRDRQQEIQENLYTGNVFVISLESHCLSIDNPCTRHTMFLHYTLQLPSQIIS